MNVNGAIFLMLTNQTFSNMFPVVNVRFICFNITNNLTTIAQFELILFIFLGILHGTWNIHAWAFQWNVQNRHILYNKTNGGDADTNPIPYSIHLHILLDGWNEPRHFAVFDSVFNKYFTCAGAYQMIIVYLFPCDLNYTTTAYIDSNWSYFWLAR